MKIVLFWMIGAALVFLSRGSAIASFAAIGATAFAYTRFVARERGVSHALGVGATWLSLSIATEIACGCSALLGAPDRPLLRNIHLFVWVFAPAIFAQREHGW